MLPEALVEALQGHYTLERELGRGGMATVFLAHDLRHGRRVALKVLHPKLIPDLGAERFQREIRVAARLQHPHILTVLDSGHTSDGSLWYTMPFVEGESLRERMRREGPLPLEEALRLAREMADGLSYAHGQGVIHRDIKPENILLSAGHALIADFGIARALSEPSMPDDEAGVSHLTRTGAIIGTPAYMSPEQASGERGLDPRSDLYSLGVVLYEMLAGTPPFSGTSARSILTKHLVGERRSLRVGRPSVPEPVDAAILKALAPEREDRFASTAEFAQALGQSYSPPSNVITPSAVPSPAHVLPRGSRLAVGLFGLILMVAIAAGVSWWLVHRTWNAGTGAAPNRLAVLPFENVGEPDNEYFADGVADAVRGKLSMLPGLQVIASTSSDQYKRTSKAPQQIGRELGVRYLVVGKVRWQKGGDSNRVQVSPELIEARTGTTRWQQLFDAPLSDVFRVQENIAGGVADALEVAVGASGRQHLEERPTQNLAAYDAFLRGEQSSGRAGVTDPSAVRRAIAAYEEATALDPRFALAWAQLSRARSLVYINASRSSADANGARAAAEQAIALGPDLPQAHFAWAFYLSGVRREHARALEVVTRARRLAPGDADLLAMAGLAEQQLSRWKEALAHFQQAQSLDPRSLATARRLARVLLWLRRYAEARQACDYALSLSAASPDVLDIKLVSFLGQGDLAGARAALRDSPSELNSTRLIAHTASYFNIFWILNEEQQELLLRLGPGAFEDDRSAWALTLAQTHRLRGNAAAARAYADSAVLVLKSTAGMNPRDAVVRANLGLALALGGQAEEARREAELAMKLEPIPTNGITGPLVQHYAVLTYLAVGDREAALDRLEPLLQVPYFVSPAWLRIDPTLVGLRNTPRFQKLLAAR